MLRAKISANFARKIQVFKVLSKEPALSPVVSTQLVKNLDQVRDLRNRFAHYPITFDSCPPPSDQKLTAALVCRDKEIVLDDSFFKETDQLFASVRTDLDKVLTTLNTPPPAAP